jgi:hypothetical protein
VTITTIAISPYIFAQGEEIACYPALGIAVVRDGVRTYSGTLLTPRQRIPTSAERAFDRLRDAYLRDDIDELGPLTVDEDFSDEDFSDEAAA